MENKIICSGNSNHEKAYVGGNATNEIVPNGLIAKSEVKIKDKEKQNELKPCPFCGSDKIIKTTIDGWGVSKYGRARIECKNCGLKTRYFEEEFKGEYVEEYWNRRVNQNENIQ